VFIFFLIFFCTPIRYILFIQGNVYYSEKNISPMKLKLKWFYFEWQRTSNNNKNCYSTAHWRNYGEGGRIWVSCPPSINWRTVFMYLLFIGTNIVYFIETTNKNPNSPMVAVTKIILLRIINTNHYCKLNITQIYWNKAVYLDFWEFFSKTYRYLIGIFNELSTIWCNQNLLWSD